MMLQDAAQPHYPKRDSGIYPFNATEPEQTIIWMNGGAKSVSILPVKPEVSLDVVSKHTTAGTD